MSEMEEKMNRNRNMLEFMLSRIKSYINKKLYIGYLICDLESFLNQIDIKDRKWINNFRRTWLDLEESYAVSLDKGLEDLDEEGDAIVDNAVLELKKMVITKMEQEGFKLPPDCLHDAKGQNDT